MITVNGFAESAPLLNDQMQMGNSNPEKNGLFEILFNLCQSDLDASVEPLLEQSVKINIEVSSKTNENVTMDQSRLTPMYNVLSNLSKTDNPRFETDDLVLNDVLNKEIEEKEDCDKSQQSFNLNDIKTNFLYYSFKNDIPHLFNKGAPKTEEVLLEGISKTVDNNFCGPPLHNQKTIPDQNLSLKNVEQQVLKEFATQKTDAPFNQVADKIPNLYQVEKQQLPQNQKSNDNENRVSNLFLEKGYKSFFMENAVKVKYVDDTKYEKNNLFNGEENLGFKNFIQPDSELPLKTENQLANEPLLKSENNSANEPLLKSETKSANEPSLKIENETAKEFILKDENKKTDNSQEKTNDVIAFQNAGNDIALEQDGINSFDKVAKIQSSSLGEGVAEKLKIMVKENKKEFHITLTPKDLGEITLELVSDKDGVKAKIVTQNFSVKQEIDRQSASIMSVLKEQGCSLNSIEVHVKNTNNSFDLFFGQENRKQHQNEHYRQNKNSKAYEKSDVHIGEVFENTISITQFDYLA